MTVKEAGDKWGYTPSQIKRLKEMLLTMPDEFLVMGHITIPDDSPRIFVPDKRHMNTRGYYYRYLMVAIGLNSLLYPQTIGITAEDQKAFLEELLNNHDIKRKDPKSVSWNTTDFMIPHPPIWGRESAKEKRDYFARLAELIGRSNK